jgi:Tol biopolymer transport system component
VGPDPQHIVGVREESGVNRLEYPIGKVLFQSSKGIGYPRLSHKGDRVAFIEAGEVKVVDASGKAATLSKGWSALNGLAWAPSDKEIWFTASREGQNQAIYAVTLGGKERPVYRAPGQLVLLDISADGRVLFDRQLARWGFAAWDAKAGEERDLTWFDSGDVAALSPDGSHVLFHEDGDAVGGKDTIFLRGTDGSPAVRLGEGRACDLSPNGEWVLAKAPGEKGGQLQLIPTGAGQPKLLTSDGLNHRWARWMPDGKRFVFFGNEPGKRPRLYVQSVERGAPKPLVPEGNYLPDWAVSPDGRDLAFCDLDKGGMFLVSTDGGAPRPLPGKQEVGKPITFSADGKALLIGRRKVFRVDLSTGQRTLVREFKPADPAGFGGPLAVLMTPDEKVYAYNYYRELSDLFLAEGLK